MMFGRRGNDGALRARGAALDARRGPHLRVAPSPQGSPHQQAHGSRDAASPAPASDNDAAAATTIGVEAARILLQPIIDAKLESGAAQRRPREEVAREIEEITR